jgi:hypothetical protein
MTFGHWIAIAVTAVVALELWTGVAVMPWSAHKGPLPRNRDHLFHREDFALAYWMAIGLHVAGLAFVWWTILSERPASFVQPMN